MRYGYASIANAQSADLVCKAAAQAAIDVPRGATLVHIQAHASNDVNVRGGGVGVVADAGGMVVVGGSGLNTFELSGATKLIGYAASDTTVKVYFGGC